MRLFRFTFYTSWTVHLASFNYPLTSSFVLSWFNLSTLALIFHSHHHELFAQCYSLFHVIVFALVYVDLCGVVYISTFSDFPCIPLFHFLITSPYLLHLILFSISWPHSSFHLIRFLIICFLIHGFTSFVYVRFTCILQQTVYRTWVFFPCALSSNCLFLHLICFPLLAHLLAPMSGLGVWPLK